MSTSPTLPINVFMRTLELSAKLGWVRTKNAALVATLTECASEEEMQLILSLVERFRLINFSDLQQFVSMALNHCESIWTLDLSRCVFATVHADRKVDSAQVLMSFMKPILAAKGISDDLVFPSLSAALEAAKKVGTLVLFDDFVGSGTKLSSAMDRVEREFRIDGIGKPTVYGCFHIVQAQALPLLKGSLSDFFLVEKHSKGISDYFDGPSLTSAVTTMERIESRLAEEFKRESLDEYRFGFQRSEAITAVDGFSPPDNVFPIFWWPELVGPKKRTTMFARWIA